MTARQAAGTRTGRSQAFALAFALTPVIALALAPAAARADVLTLEALERAALGDRAALQASAAASKAARAEIEKAESAYNPTLMLQAEAGVAPGRKLIRVENTDDGEEYLTTGTRALNEEGAFNPSVRTELGLELRGNLYDFGRTRAAVEASRARSAAVAAERGVTARAILDAVRAAYLAWLGSHELLTFAKQNAGDAGERRARVQALIGEGVRPAADLTPAQADEALAALELERANGELRAARLALEQAVGMPLPQAAQPDRNVLDRYAPLAQSAGTAAGAGAGAGAGGTRDELSRLKPGADPTADALALQASAARATARAAERADAPVLSGALTAGVNAQSLDAFPGYAAGIALTVPLWDGGASSASAGAGYARAAELDARGRAQRANERDRRARAALDADNAGGLLRAASALQAICDQRLREAEQAYELGAAGIDAIAQARAALRRAQSEVVLARLARVQAALAVRAEP